MQVEEAAGEILVLGSAYRLLLPREGHFATLTGADGRPWLDLFLAWSMHSGEGLDSSTGVGRPIVEPGEHRTRILVPLSGGRWQDKALLLDCFEERLALRLVLQGEGSLGLLEMGAGYYSGARRDGAGRFRSRSHFDHVFCPEPTRRERETQPADSLAVIDVLGGALPGAEHWFFTPAPFFFGLGRGAEWLGCGLAAQIEENNFTRFAYEGQEEGFCLQVDYEGQTRLSGAWESPALLLEPGASDPYASMASYVRRLELDGLVPAPPTGERPDWWGRPIFCGWGAQCHQAQLSGLTPSAHASEADYDRFLAVLAAHGVTAGTVVIDDKWQLDYGSGLPDREKWADLKAWIADRHQAGQHVLLWWKAWDPEGLAPALCVVDAAGRPLAADPSNLAYEEELRRSITYLLSPEGLDADGLKVDFTARTPSGPGLTRTGNEWGVELLHRLLEIIHDAAHRAKPDALVVTHAANPYFRDVTDMVRLNDINGQQPVAAQMRRRAKVAQIALPGVPIDTDNWPLPDLAAWREYLAIQPELGIPALYYASHLDGSGEELTEADYAALRRAWRGVLEETLS